MTLLPLTLGTKPFTAFMQRVQNYITIHVHFQSEGENQIVNMA